MNRLATRSWAAGGCLLALLAAGLVIAGRSSSPELAVQSGTSASDSGNPRVDPATVEEMTVDGMAPRACGGVAPIDVLVAPPGAEDAATPEAAGLREVFAHDPTKGMSPQTPHGWVLMSQDENSVSFGQRTGAVGISATVFLERAGEKFVFSGSGGCGPVGYADGRGADLTGAYIDRGDHLEISYGPDECQYGLDEIRVHEFADRVDVLLVHPKPKSHAGYDCAGEAVTGTLNAPLQRPLAGRIVRNIGYLPAREMVSLAQYQAQQTADTVDFHTVRRLCRPAGEILHLPVDIVYLSDVASVRAAVPATRSSWSSLDDDAVAADCYLTNPDESRTAVVNAIGVHLVIRDRHHTGPNAERIPEIGGRPYRH